MSRATRELFALPHRYQFVNQKGKSGIGPRSARAISIGCRELANFKLPKKTESVCLFSCSLQLAIKHHMRIISGP